MVARCGHRRARGHAFSGNAAYLQGRDRRACRRRLACVGVFSQRVRGFILAPSDVGGKLR